MGTVSFHRVLRSTPERIYKAFTSAEAFAKWLPPHGFTAHVYALDAREGGSYRMHFTNHSTGNAHAFGGKYVELKPGAKVRYTATFEDPNLPGEMTTTVTLSKVSCGTEVRIVQEGIPDVIPTDGCYLGWQESLGQLAKLVEADIPD